MLKSASTHTILSDASEELIGNEPWTIDVYADGLMDEIFADVEDILEGKRLGSQFKQKSPVKSRPIVNPEIPGQIKPINLHHQQAATKTVVKSPPSDSTVNKAKTSNEKNNLSPKSGPRWKKLISVSVSLALATAGLTWLIYSGLVDRIFARIFAEELHLAQIEQSLTEKSLTEKIDPQIELVNYMLGALAAIEQGEPQDTSSSNGMMASVTGNFQGSTIQNSAIQSSIPIASANAATGSLPPVRAANNLQPMPSRSTKVVERIYIPVYQAPAPMRYKPPSVASASPGNLPPVREVAHKSYSKTSKSNAGKAAKNTVPAATLTLMKTELKPVGMGNRPVAVGVAPQPKPVIPPKLTDAKAPIENNPSVNTASVQHQEVAFAAAKPSHELLGVMELGEKSAALFKIEGITRRIHKGESIGSSGWTLVDVSNNEIVVRRNGEVRSIQTGQKI
ncbi:hypothetical protein [Mastigocoleus testarum]|uniref:Type II secretion system protein GspC N-terminal domain-containing protein n=1 Tax=Mastigocoleus testarum BC008 TaxID=371196 RepID=A0A0V7ZHA2_9CYAN|nr:hypothetical protein [Mastigocoleus testarum]KST63973.1 hypothetical protein BC008_39935 [Mastigocoleus testarum BC008]KST64683.1 hypothetical protein BC008_40910 [Mastigocoleus testarum BC008]